MYFLKKCLALACPLCLIPAFAEAKPHVQCSSWGEKYITANADRYDEYLENTISYIDIVVNVLNEENLDLKWIWLMLVESGGKMERTSDAGASGLWQLMKSTANHYGCYNIDDIACSTRAAARYIKKLLADFSYNIKDVVAAYSMGGNNYKKYGTNPNVRAYSSIIGCLMMKRNIHEELKRITLPEADEVYSNEEIFEHVENSLDEAIWESSDDIIDDDESDIIILGSNGSIFAVAGSDDMDEAGYNDMPDEVPYQNNHNCIFEFGGGESMNTNSIEQFKASSLSDVSVAVNKVVCDVAAWFAAKKLSNLVVESVNYIVNNAAEKSSDSNNE